MMKDDGEKILNQFRLCREGNDKRDRLSDLESVGRTVLWASQQVTFVPSTQSSL